MDGVVCDANGMCFANSAKSQHIATFLEEQKVPPQRPNFRGAHRPNVNQPRYNPPRQLIKYVLQTQITILLMNILLFMVFICSLSQNQLF